MRLKTAVQRLKCSLGYHDWEAVESLEIDHNEEINETVAVHYRSLLPVEYRCDGCGRTEEIGFSNIEARDSDGGVIESWSSSREK